MPVPISSSDMHWTSAMEASHYYDCFNDPMISDDVWKKFDLLDLPFSEFNLRGEECWDHPAESGNRSTRYTIRHHDCMWSGRCIDKSHPEKKCSLAEPSFVVPPPPMAVKPTVAAVAATVKLQSVTVQTVQTIPAGRSLLLNSRNNANKMPMKSIIKTINHVVEIKPEPVEIKQEPVEIKKELEEKRPDTPRSLDDEEDMNYKTIDPTICNSSPNKLPLNQGLKELNLLDALKHISTGHPKFTPENTTFIVGRVPSGHLSPKSEIEDFVDVDTLKVLEDAISDYDFDEDSLDLCEYFDSENEEEDEEDDEEDMGNSVEASSTDIGTGDHCYTLSKARMDSLGVQTPSDSEEEIDVVSIGDKTLPNNPSARDRRHFQTTVARKISVSRIVKQPGGLKTLPPRRPSGKGPHNAPHTPKKRSRKRSEDEDVDDDEDAKPSKKARGRKKLALKNKYVSDSDGTETLERRSLHNNMERQRRIGLKNLFDELKMELPSIRSKDRTPKVTILREAAALCRKLKSEEDAMASLKKQQNRLLARVKTLRTSLAHMRVK